MENPQPWVNGVEHLGKLIIRIHFVGGAVRDVDLRGVLTAEELRTLEADPKLLDQVGTRVVWPTGAHLDSAMLSLIHEGYGARAGGWPATAPPQPADAPFPVPPMATGGRSPADWMPPTSSSLSRLEKFDKMVRRFSERAPTLAEWWTTAQPRLVGDLSGAERRSILRNGRAVAKALSSHLQIFVEQLLEQTGAVDAIAEDAELAALVERAQRWNAIWELQQEQAAAAVFDPLENPQGYRVELEGRLRAVEESTSE